MPMSPSSRAETECKGSHVLRAMGLCLTTVDLRVISSHSELLLGILQGQISV